MKLKRTIAVIFSAALALAIALFAVACGDKTPETESPEISISETSVEMLYGEKYTLSPEYNDVDGLSVVWSSDNEAVATVADGVITAAGSGSAKITATYGTASATCTVNVGFGDYEPELKIAHATSNSIRLGLNSSFEIDAFVFFNGKSYPCSVTAEVGDGDVVTFADGKITAVGIGTTEVSVKTDWNSFDTSLTEKTIEVEVINDVNITPSVSVGGKTSVSESVELSMVSAFAGNTYDTSATVEFIVQDNGTRKAATGTIVSGADVISLENGVITAKGVGSAVVRAEYTDSLGNDYSSSINIEVIVPVVDYTNKIEFCTENGFPVETYFGSGATIISASSEGKPLTVAGNVIGLVAKGDDTAAFEVLTTKGGYRFTDVYAYTRKITDANGFKNTFSLVNGTVTDGYYLLGNDITGVNSSYQTLSGSNTTYFKGTLDGCGYTVSATVNQNGLFGALADGAVIKNAKFVLTFPSGSACGFANNNAIFNAATSSVTLENLYIETTNYYAESSALMDNKPNKLKMTDVYVNIKGNAALGEFNDASTTRRALFRYDQSLNNGFTGQFSGDVRRVYVVTETFIPIACGRQTWGEHRLFVTYAVNDTDELGSFTRNNSSNGGWNYYKIKNANAADDAKSKLFGTDDSSGYYTYIYGAHFNYKDGGIYRYDTVAELKEAGVTQVGSWTVE